MTHSSAARVLDEGRRGQGGAWKEKIARDAERLQVKKWRKALRDLKTEIVQIKAQLKAALKSARTDSKARRQLVRQTIKQRRAEVLAELRAWAHQQRQAARDVAAAERASIRRQYGDTLAAKQKQAEADARYLREITRIGAAVSKRKESTLKEIREESDDAVRSNIHPGLIPLWEKMKRGIKGSARKSRLEQFLEAVESTKGEREDLKVLAQMAVADENVQRAIEKQQALEAEMYAIHQAQKKGPAKAIRREARAARLAALPPAPF